MNVLVLDYQIWLLIQPGQNKDKSFWSFWKSNVSMHYWSWELWSAEWASRSDKVKEIYKTYREFKAQSLCNKSINQWIIQINQINYLRSYIVRSIDQSINLSTNQLVDYAKHWIWSTWYDSIRPQLTSLLKYLSSFSVLIEQRRLIGVRLQPRETCRVSYFPLFSSQKRDLL